MDKENMATLGVIGILITIILSILLVPPYMEAKTFNKLTGKNATYIDALFSELRITGCKAAQH